MPAAKPPVMDRPTTKTGAVAPFAIEADHPTNSDLLILCVPNCKLRSALSAARTFEQQNKDGTTTTRTLAASVFMGPVSNMPGMQLHVDPTKNEVHIVDPLSDEKNKSDLDRLTHYARGRGLIGGHVQMRGVPNRTEKIDQHNMKTLCRELWHIVEAGQAKVVDGQLPDLETINSMDGEYLSNPGARVKSSMPKFEKDIPAWEDSLERMH